MFEVIANYNAQSEDYVVVPLAQPSGPYHEVLAGAALSGDLPCVFDWDGPLTAQVVEDGWVVPLEGRIDEAIVDDMLQSIIDQGTIDGTLYSLGIFDSGLGLWGNRAMLEEAGVRIPESVEDAWTLEEFNAALEALAAVVPADGYAIDLGLSGSGEWFSYAYGPILRSFGGDTIDRSTYETAEGVLNGDAAFAFGTWLQSVVDNGYTSTAPVDPTADFNEGRTALSYVGHWRFPQFSEGQGENLVLIPMPDFGNGTIVGNGSYTWGVSTNCGSPEAEAGGVDFLNFLLSPESMSIVTQASGGPPSSITVLEADERFQEGGPMHIYFQQLAGGYAVPRAQTPVYGTISAAMGTMIQAIAAGEPVQAALDAAVDTIDAAIAERAE